jgi:DNA-binding GntR family transcriptional regulator
MEHEQILHAVAGRDAERAAALARVHLEHAAANVQLMLPKATVEAAAVVPRLRR